MSGNRMLRNESFAKALILRWAEQGSNQDDKRVFVGVKKVVGDRTLAMYRGLRFCYSL